MDVCGSGTDAADIRGYFYSQPAQSSSPQNVQWGVVPMDKFNNLIVDEESTKNIKNEQVIETVQHSNPRDDDEKPDVKKMHLDEGDQAETMEDKQQKYIPVPPGTLRELGNGNFKLTLSSYKTVNLSLFNKALYAHIWNNAASRCITLTMDEINTLLENREKIFAVFSLLQSCMSIMDQHNQAIKK